MELLKLNAKNKEEKAWRETQAYQQGIGMQNKRFLAPCVSNLVNKPKFDMMSVKTGNPSSCFLTQVADMQRQPLTRGRVFGLSKEAPSSSSNAPSASEPSAPYASSNTSSSSSSVEGSVIVDDEGYPELVVL